MKDMDEVIKDPRFSHIVKDARFKRLPRKHVKVKVDKRFQSMFTDKKFQIKCHIDKRGKPVDIRGSEDLKRYYDLSESEEEPENEEDVENVDEQSEDESNEEESVGDESDEECETETESPQLEVKDKEEEGMKQEEKIKKGGEEKSESKVNNKTERNRKLMTADIKKKLRNSKIDYARGEGKFLSESSSEEEVTDDEASDYEEHDWGELHNDAETTEEATNRLAICHMDWDRIKAVDLMVLFNSFLPPGGFIHSITIYPSEFGIQRMKEEEEKGPMEFKEMKDVKEDEEMDREQMEKLRKYQLNRLKYYYAVMVCDTKETANAIYKECDGLEYECSAIKLDLRFVPNETTFDQEPKDSCTAMPDLSTYKPRLFQTTALTRSKVELTWDENDPDRDDLVRSVRSGKIDENLLKQYLAYSTSEDSDYEEAKILINDNVDDSTTKPETELSAIEKYKSLLADIELKEKKKKKDSEVNLEVTWNLKLENKASEVVKEKMKEKDNLTPFEQYLDKKKEKKKKKKQERMAQIEQPEKESEENAFSDDDIPSDVDLNDPYFREELDEWKPKKNKKKEKNVEEESETEDAKQKKAELELLLLDEESQDKHFSLKKIQESENMDKKKKFKKGKKRKVEEDVRQVDDFKIDLNDERFSALYSSHHFNIDPTDPHYKPTKATKELIEEKLRRRAREEEEPAQKSRKIAEDNKKKKAELSILVKNIKKNTSEMKQTH